jgi:hypothetical protein
MKNYRAHIAATSQTFPLDRVVRDPLAANISSGHTTADI